MFELSKVSLQFASSRCFFFFERDQFIKKLILRPSQIKKLLRPTQIKKLLKEQKLCLL